MERVDCHVHTELMGDGVSHAHAEDALEVRCESCHGPDASGTTTRWAEVRDGTTLALLRLRGETRPPEEPVRTGSRGTPLWNVRPREGEGWVLRRKRDGAALAIPPTPVDADHVQPGHERLSCVACHAAWAPTCPTCHTRFDADAAQWDFGAGREIPGAWIETNEGVGLGPPALGVSARDRIEPAIPGMIATLDLPGGEQRRVRRFSLLDPHTTTRRARRCTSCHDGTVALGLGEGTLERGPSGPRFIPSHADPADSRRAKAGWVGLAPAEPGQGTRIGDRSFDAREHQRILFVGACLPCHLRGDALYRAFEEGASRWRAGRATLCMLSP